ncbi:hypothetical protein [Variovorax sp. EBFNA2]|uniref:deoxynucleotide monophosphate kinase family protein n=1 Tax=Variovorax sp. EBFNA2 TaxID=3342097 RepID=UPI0029BFB0AB|nr:hypothetical protein [Variovorax boronicumulans]WPG35161.1 hypothetical protein RZE79_16850 [Variovorax boronicumulans]
MKKHIIALTGYAGVGKDTIADLLVAHLGFRKVAFADALRAEVADGFGVEILHLAHPSTKNHPISALALRRAPRELLAAIALSGIEIPRNGSGQPADEWLDQPRAPRQILQWWGTEYRRATHSHYWARLLLKRLANYIRDGEKRFVITDCRFRNEADTVRFLGGHIWKVTRPGINSTTTSEGSHVSATDGSEFMPDVILANSHDVRHLQQLVLSEFLSTETGIAGASVTVPA